MNYPRQISRWRCDTHACPAIAFGVGSSTMLRALGWCVRPGIGGTKLCPACRRDGGLQAAEAVTDQIYDELQVFYERSLHDKTKAATARKEKVAAAIDHVNEGDPT